MTLPREPPHLSEFQFPHPELGRRLCWLDTTRQIPEQHMRLSGHSRAVIAVSASAALLVGVPALAGAVVDDARLTPHTHFVMAADGSTGTTARGDSIPNIDSVK